MSNWYAQWMHIKQERQTLDRLLEMRRLEHTVIDGSEHTEGLPTRMLLALGCWIEERARQPRDHSEVFQSESVRLGRIEVRPIMSACECDN